MQPGDVLADRYEVEDLVGRGGMGQVWRATDSVLGRRVALKVLSAELVDDDESVARILTEARLAAKVRHPNVVQVLDALVGEDHSPVIVLEYVDGPSLAHVIRDRAPLPIDEALDIVGEVAAGLAAAHVAELVHRDVSPSNILLDDGTARLTDFGIARSTTTSATLTGTIRGSVAYVAPEQATGTEVGPASDVYALACVALTMLTGRPPYDADEPLGVVHQHVSAPPPDVRTLRPEVPMEVAVALQAAMAKDPARRIPSAAALAAAVGRPLRHDETEVVFLPPTHGEAGSLSTPGPVDTTGDETAAFGPSAPVPPSVGADSQDLAVGAASVVSASSVSSTDADGSGSGPIVVIGTTTDPGLDHGATGPSGGGRRVPARWLLGAAAVAGIVGVLVGQLTSAPDGTVAEAAASGQPGDGDAEEELREQLEDAVLAARGALVDLQAQDQVGDDRGAVLDDRIDALLAAVQDGASGRILESRLEQVREAVRNGVEAEELEPEAELPLLEALLAVDEALALLEAAQA